VSATNARLQSSAPYRPAIRHAGPCGHRRHCHRATCRERFGDLPTIELLSDGRAIAYCHRAIVPVDALLLEMIEAAA
jgi:hypothetical protein